MTDTNKLKNHLKEYAKKRGNSNRWELLLVAVGWQLGEPVPPDIIDYIDQLYEEDLITA